MTSFERDQLRARTEALQAQADAMMATYEQQLRDIGQARDVLAIAKSEGWSDDNLVRVTTNSAGVPIEVWVDPSAFKRSQPDKLGISFLQAAQAAARAAKSEIDAVLGPVTAAAAEFTPPEDPFESLPFIGRPIGDVLPPLPTAEPTAPQESERAYEDEDEGPHWKGIG
ncbi:YbaB/EbfC family nucleoid-associated protein [Nocardia arthritidis]|uniref:YbaB/EbfC family DNA-binding protein n=1 Tax=Nocardia arthritidis TaxID=228602 RepID=A0A6G9Y7I4_9NOCA|nr:YbaB/EbfC family nucleoid-associated protein [Nocardia arthritidis]QIS09171.1 YbaB/EbfC family DNA-binding protein [Nocardia arthritidis]